VERKPIRLKPAGANYEVRVHGARKTPLRDFYYATLGQPWSVTLLMIASAFLAVNALFALGYWVAGGIANANPHSFADAFFFSVQTMGTIGYGAMYPASRAANWLVVAESIVGLTLTALATGLIFAKFSRPTARIVFSREAAISPMNGIPTLMFRIGNERRNPIVDAKIRVSLVRTELTHEGKTFYRMQDLKLTRDRALSLSRSWSVIHAIDETSPLRDATPDSLVRDEAELQVLVVGLDDTSMQPVHARHQYSVDCIRWGARLVDILSEADDGALVLNLRLFHDVEPTPPTSDFPYSLERPGAVRIASG
jgi:inward rectifier potassium channel